MEDFTPRDVPSSLNIMSGTTPTQRDRARRINRTVITGNPNVPPGAVFVLRPAETAPLYAASRGWARLVLSTATPGPAMMEDLFIDISPTGQLRLGSYSARGYIEESADDRFDDSTLRRALTMGAAALADERRPFHEAAA